MDDGGWKAGWLLWHWAKAIEKNGKTNKTSGWQQCWWHHWILFMCSKQQVASGESQLDSWATEECKLVLLLAFLFVFAVNPSKTKQCDILQEDMLLSRIGSGIRSEEGHGPQCVWCTSKKWDEVVWGWHDVSVVSLNWIQKACGWLLFCSDLMVESVDTVGCCFCNGRRIVVSLLDGTRNSKQKEFDDVDICYDVNNHVCDQPTWLWWCLLLRVMQESDASDHGQIKAMHMVDTSLMIQFVGDTTTEAVQTTK